MSLQFGSVRPQPSTPAAALPATQPAGPRTWLREIIGGGQIIERCPAWCTLDHKRDQRGNLDDLVHASDAAEMFLATFDHWSDDTPVTLPIPVLRADVRVDPYSANPKRSQPFVSFEPFMDEVMDELGPDELAAIIAQIRAHADRLDGVLAQLVAARAGYEAGGVA